MRIARRLQNLAQSDIRRMTRECERVGGINLGQGICDLPTPPLVRDGAIAAIRENRSTYSFAEGTLELRRAIAEKLRRDNGIEADPASEVCVTVGASGAYAATLNALLDPGDGLLLFEPYYGYHLNAALVSGLVPQFVTLAPPDFTLREEALEAAITGATRAVVVCTPSNPSGKMFSREDLSALARVAKKHDLLVITDEIYEYIRYDGRAHVSPATVDGLRDRTVTIMGLSKTFSITGWRLGYAVAPPELTRAITLVNDLDYVCAPTPLQLGAAAGFAAPRSYFDELQSGYQRKRDAICSALVAAGLPPIVPQGAYYVLADCSRLGLRASRDAAMHVLETARVASVPGSAFYRGAEGEKLLRFCFAKDDEVLDDACRRLRALQ
ncbi:MAG TPA: aminotransferase class I/II-fold pyridoxal phosphate-dependent enzyme [Myxococcales bacterium]|nr:aminotransferase class I/II-fold pyridoxal phosphate-dependent enzyme [Myxococcales bacterium]